MRTSNIHRRSVLQGLAALGSTGLLGSAWPRRAKTPGPANPSGWWCPTRRAARPTSRPAPWGEKLGPPGPARVGGQPGGAGGVSGTDHALKSPADGYTLLVSLGTTMLINQFLYERLPYQPQKTRPSSRRLPWRRWCCWCPATAGVQRAGADGVHRPQQAGRLRLVGGGSYAHLAGAWLSDKLKADMNHVPGKGEAPMLQDLVGGQLQMAFASLQSARPYIESGRLKTLAVTPARSAWTHCPRLPPCPNRAIGDEVFQVTGWFGMSAPAKTPLKWWPAWAPSCRP